MSKSHKNRVKIRPGSRYGLDSEDEHNPLGVTGTIIGFDPDDYNLYLRVKWDNGLTNWYSLGDLYEV